jgi:methylated-DNA-[protein]-cysteine S-methyltransferase
VTEGAHRDGALTGLCFPRHWPRPVADARDVGAAVGRNPLRIVIPCHRVVGSNGKLTGYAGGLDRKRALLEIEHATALRTAQSPAAGLW